MPVQVKVHEDLEKIHESVFFGLSLRQTVCSVLAIITAVGLYFLLNPILGGEFVSWICVLGAVPFACLGFLNYNKMPAEKLFLAWFRFQILEPKKLLFKPTNIYYELEKENFAKREKEMKKQHESD